MGDIVALSELRTKIRRPTGDDAELNQIILEAEEAFQGAIGQKLIATNYTEVRSGDGRAFMSLKRYPVNTITSITLTGEPDIVLDATSIKFTTGVTSDGVLKLLRRTFTKGEPDNITVTYNAGFASQAVIKATMGDAWSVVLDRCAVLWMDAQTGQKGVQAQSYMDGSITYMADPAWRRKHETRWRETAGRYQRRLPSAMAVGW